MSGPFEDRSSDGGVAVSRGPRTLHLAPGESRVLLLAAAACAVVAIGWSVFWFLTDDAFIAFRYVSNSRLGFGYTWNPPPFRPVEGYTSFLWVALLDLVWRLTGVEPPASANLLSLACACGSVIVTGLAAARMELTGPLARRRFPAIALVLLMVATNRTFLTWTSSGLETALFNLLSLAWLYVFLYVDGDPRRWVFMATLLAALAALARPEGIVFVAATACGVVLAWRAGAAGPRIPVARVLAARDLAAAAPLAIVPAHLLWRRSEYGVWLPNTWYAKTTGVWPASGLRYLLCYVIEYSLWITIAVVLLWAWKSLWARDGARIEAEIRTRRLRIACVAIAFLVPFAYYTLVVGGDHFEFRVYSGLVPLLALVTLFCLDRLGWRATPACSVLAVASLAAMPIPYVHYLETRGLQTRQETYHLVRPIAGRFPPPLSWYVSIFDRNQAWLIDRWIGARHQEHKVFAASVMAATPTRAQGELIPWDGHPVAVAFSPGILAYDLPHVAFIDYLGLGDHVIARSPVVSEEPRQMAHERRPPEGYIDCFKPNVDLALGRVKPRPLTDDDIRACEDRWWAWAARQKR
jgi:arabinofuranosyltransferase